MSMKYYCDNCGKENKSRGLSFVIVRDFMSEDWCKKCRLNLVKYIKTNKKIK